MSLEDPSIGVLKVEVEKETPMTMLEQDQIERFWTKVNQEPGQGPNGDCWEWTAGQKNQEGYGGFYVRQINNTMNSHKVAFLIVHNFALDDIPDGIVIRHSCNNPKCVRPLHLKLGTPADNSQDMIDAGHSLTGERNPKYKLNPELVKTIRELWSTGEWTKAAIAEKLGVSQSAVWQVATNRNYYDPDYSAPTFPETHNHKCKYTDDVIENVREMRKAGTSVREIVQVTGMCQSQVYNIIHNRQRKEVVE